MSAPMIANANIARRVSRRRGWSLNPDLRLSRCCFAATAEENLLDLPQWRVGESCWRQAFRYIESRHADPLVRHAIVNVEAVR